MLISLLPLYGFANEVEEKYSLTLCYRQEENAFEGITLSVYRVATLNDDGGYEAAGEFAELPVSLNDIRSQTVWREVCSTFSAYAVGNNIRTDYTATTDKDGRAVFSDILPGLYLTMSVKGELSGETVIFEDFLTAVPSRDEKGEAVTDVTAYPKGQTVIPGEDELEHKVVKQWRGNANDSNRPQYINVDIIKDGAVESSQRLSPDNNWSYSWTAKDDGSVWQAVERNVPAGYTVTVTKNQTTIIVTNTYDSGEEEPPQTGDTTQLWPYAAAMTVAGVLFILLAALGKRKEA